MGIDDDDDDRLLRGKRQRMKRVWLHRIVEITLLPPLYFLFIFGILGSCGVFWYLGDVLFDWSPSVVIFMAKPQLILIMIVFDNIILPVIRYNHSSSFAF